MFCPARENAAGTPGFKLARQLGRPYDGWCDCSLGARTNLSLGGMAKIGIVLT